MEPLRVLIVDDQLITRRGLCSLFASVPEITLVGEASSGAEAVELVAQEEPDVVLMDLRMPGMSGIEATRRIHRSHPHIGILVLTGFEEDAFIFPALRAGARGYLLKNADQHELLRAIQTVAGGGGIFSPGIAQRVMQYLAAPPPTLPRQFFEELTTREQAMLELIAQGKTNSEIAERLVLSPKTVSNAISTILLKVQAADRAKLMLMALEAGLGREGSSQEEAGEGEQDGGRG